MFVFPCIISQYYIKNQQDTTLAVLLISNCKITLHIFPTVSNINCSYSMHLPKPYNLLLV